LDQGVELGPEVVVEVARWPRGEGAEDPEQLVHQVRPVLHLLEDPGALAGDDLGHAAVHLVAAGDPRREADPVEAEVAPLPQLADELAEVVDLGRRLLPAVRHQPLEVLPELRLERLGVLPRRPPLGDAGLQLDEDGVEVHDLALVPLGRLPHGLRR
jgi:hypothetical protein